MDYAKYLISALADEFEHYENVRMENNSKEIVILDNNEIVATIDIQKRHLTISHNIPPELYTDIFDLFSYYAAPRYELRLQIVNTPTEFCPYLVHIEGGFDIVSEDDINQYELKDYTFTDKECVKVINNVGMLVGNVVRHERF